MQERRGRCLYLPRCVSISTTEQKTAKASTPGTIWTNIDNSGKRHTLKKLQAPALIWTTWTTEHRHGAGGVHIRPVVCVVFTTGQKPETDERHAFSFGRVLAVFVKCRNTTENTAENRHLPPFFGYFWPFFGRFLAVFGQRPPRRVEAIPYTPPNMDNVDNMDNTRKKRPDV